MEISTPARCFTIGQNIRNVPNDFKFWNKENMSKYFKIFILKIIENIGNIKKYVEIYFMHEWSPSKST